MLNILNLVDLFLNSTSIIYVKQDIFNVQIYIKKYTFGKLLYIVLNIDIYNFK